MNSHNEKEEILRLGNIEYDVSNIPYGRTVKAIDIWNKALSKDKLTNKEIKLMIERVGLYLIRQPLMNLNRRFTALKSIKEFIKRAFLTTRYIRTSNKEDYEAFEDWISFTMTGKKKAIWRDRRGFWK